MSDTKFNILLSFIIHAHNSERTLSNCVESIENDVHLSDISCELIIIENGSEDNTLNIAKTLQKKFANVLLEVSEKVFLRQEIADWKLLQAERLFLLILMMFG